MTLTNPTAFEENEISQKANGGTELIKRRLANLIDPQLLADFQIISSRVRNLDPTKIRVYWVHDLPHDPETNHLHDVNSRNRFHKIVFCGNWQYNQYIASLSIPYDNKLAVIDNGIVPLTVGKKPTDRIDLVYMSSPQRGLQLLVPVFLELAKQHPEIHLHVFSSFEIYGWKDPEEFAPLFEQCKTHPQITYHGVKPNDFVRDVISKAHILAYPSIWPECNSLAMIEAMSAGLLCVHPNFAGLSDTTGGLTSQYQFVADVNQHANIFYNHLKHAIEIIDKEDAQNYARFVKRYADIRYNIDRIKSIWEDQLLLLKQQYPTVESRALPEQLFSYRTL